MRYGTRPVASTLMLAAMAAAAALAMMPVSARASFQTGIGDEQTAMFRSGLWRQLHTRISRYVAPYDAAVRPDELARARAWISAATAAHQTILIAFYHSEHTPTRMPSFGGYERDVRKFVRMFPQVHEYQPWDEANRGNVRRLFSSPSPRAAAGYYRALRRVAIHDAIVGLDVLDQQNAGPTLRYIASFKTAVRSMRLPVPHLWGLHNYSDTNRFGGERTREIVRALGGQVWLTETGGIVKFGGAFPDRHGSGLRRAAHALQNMFAIARANPAIRRLYIFQWTGSTPRARFDAGLTDARGRPRPGYEVVCNQLLGHSRRCRMRTSDH